MIKESVSLSLALGIHTSFNTSARNELDLLFTTVTFLSFECVDVKL